MLGLSQTKEPTEDCFVFGEDRRITEKALVSTGAFFLDKDESFAYDSIPETMGMLTIIDKKGVKTHKGQIAVLFETSAQPFDFRKGDWVEDTPNVTNLLNDGRMEGMGAVATKLEDDKRIERIMPFLWVLLCLFLLITLSACVSAGLFHSLAEVFS